MDLSGWMKSTCEFGRPLTDPAHLESGMHSPVKLTYESLAVRMGVPAWALRELVDTGEVHLIREKFGTVPL